MRTPLILAALLTLSLASCSGGELVGVHVSLHKDGSGLVTLRGLFEPTTTGAGEAKAQAVTWTSRAGVTCTQGKFDKINDLQIGDGGIRFSAQLADDRPNVRVFVRRGPDAAWITALVPDQSKRQAMAQIYDPTGRTKEIGDVLRLEVSVPGEVFGSDVRPTGRGIEAGNEGKRAYLLIPVRTGLEAGDDLEWTFSW
jgi:hypothetical protein